MTLRADEMTMVWAGNNDVQQAGEHGRCGTIVSEAARPIQWSYQTIMTATTRPCNLAAASQATTTGTFVHGHEPMTHFRPLCYAPFSSVFSFLFTSFVSSM